MNAMLSGSISLIMPFEYLFLALGGVNRGGGAGPR